MLRGLLLTFGLLLFVLPIGCASAASDEFAIYLLKERMTGTAAQAAPLGALALGERIISTRDIVSYSQGTHEIELTPEAYARVQALFKLPVEVTGIPFIICVGNARIYAGAFWTPLSSLSFDGPFILQPFAEDRHTIRIQIGYPESSAFTGRDPRPDPRIFEVMQKAGKLKAGGPPARLRIQNSGAVPIKELVIVLPEDRVAFGDVAPGATTGYRDVPHGVLRYSAYEYVADGKVILQPVVDWIGEKPLEGEAFTYTIDMDPGRAPAPQIRLDSVVREK